MAFTSVPRPGQGNVRARVHHDTTHQPSSFFTLALSLFAHVNLSGTFPLFPSLISQPLSPSLPFFPTYFPLSLFSLPLSLPLPLCPSPCPCPSSSSFQPPNLSPSDSDSARAQIASSWLESLKEAGANTMSTVGKSEHMKAVSERASKLSEGVSGLYTMWTCGPHSHHVTNMNACVHAHVHEHGAKPRG